MDEKIACWIWQGLTVRYQCQLWKIIFKKTIRNAIDFEYQVTLKIARSLKKLYCLIKTIYSQVLVPIWKLKNVKAESRSQGLECQR